MSIRCTDRAASIPDSDAATTEDDPNEDQDSEPTNTAPAGERPMDNPSES